VKRLLIVGFGPFPRVPRNPAEVLAAGVAGNPLWRRRGIRVTLLIVPTTYAAIPERLTPLLESEGFDGVLLIGLAGRRRVLSVETRAMNRVSRLFPDASGRVGAQLTLDPGGPAQRRVHGEADRVLRAVRSTGVSAKLSIDAGRYLCNASYFATLGSPAKRTIFVHVPFPRRGARDVRPAMPDMVRALTAAGIALLAGVDPPRTIRSRGRPWSGGSRPRCRSNS
jgi:pyroglutamyl-peptidase